MIFLNFFLAWLRVKYAKLFGYVVLAPLPVEEARLAICENCPQFDVEDATCRKCGCLVYSKIALYTEQCPEKRWRRIWKRRVTT